MSKEVLARVSEQTMEDGRASVPHLVERLSRERESLIAEKRKIEAGLNEIESWKRDETAKILKQHLPKTPTIERTVVLESKVRKRKAPLLREKLAVEERLHDIKRRLANSPPQNDMGKTLLRIEAILISIATLLERNK